MHVEINIRDLIPNTKQVDLTLENGKRIIYLISRFDSYRGEHTQPTDVESYVTDDDIGTAAPILVESSPSTLDDRPPSRVVNVTCLRHRRPASEHQS